MIFATISIDRPPQARPRPALPRRRLQDGSNVPHHNSHILHAPRCPAQKGPETSRQVHVLRRLLRIATDPLDNPHQDQHRELSVEELLRRARPLPPHEEMVIDDLTEEEEVEAFLAAIRS